MSSGHHCRFHDGFNGQCLNDFSIQKNKIEYVILLALNNLLSEMVPQASVMAVGFQSNFLLIVQLQQAHKWVGKEAIVHFYSLAACEQLTSLIWPCGARPTVSIPWLLGTLVMHNSIS